MKIGFSLGRCIRDIVLGNVNSTEIAFIISSTAIRDEAQLLQVIANYMYRRGYLEGLDQKLCEIAALDLWKASKILQPRLEGIYRHQQPEESIWVDIFPTALSDNAAVKTAWDNYRFMLHMTENVDNEATEIFK